MSDKKDSKTSTDDPSTLDAESNSETERNTVSDQIDEQSTSETSDSGASETHTDTATSEVTFDQPVLDDIAIGGKSQRPAKRASFTTWLVVLLLLIIMSGSAGGGYWLWQQQLILQQQQQQLSASLDQAASQAENKTRSLTSKQENLAQQINQQQQLASQQTVELERQRNAVQGVGAQLLALTSTTNDDWKLAEAHYLTRLAGQRLLMERDADSALALLVAADEIIKNRADPALYSVREQLANDIAALKLGGDVDREGLFLSLSAIGNIVNVLPKPFPDNYSVAQANESSQAEEEDEIYEEVSWWQKMQRSFLQSLSAFRDYIRITHSDETLDEILSPQAQSQLQTSLRLNIENAQWALLREESAVYQESLKRVEELLKRYYPLSDQAKQLSDQLAELRAKNIVQELPDISGSTKLLGAYLEQLHKLGTTAPKKIEEDSSTVIDAEPDTESSNQP